MTEDVFSQYLKAVRAAIDAIEATQLEAVRDAAKRFATTILAGRLVHVFGTGHSRMAVEEGGVRVRSPDAFHWGGRTASAFTCEVFVRVIFVSPFSETEAGTVPNRVAALDTFSGSAPPPS